MYKRLISLILTLCLLLGFAIPAYAADNENSDNGFFVMTENVPDDVIEHIQSSIAGIISDLYDLNSISVSYPFKLYRSYYDLYYSVVFFNGKPVGTYRVYEVENGCTGIFSENTEFIDQLLLIDNSSIDSPAKIIAGNYDDLYAVIGTQVYSIKEDPCGESTPVHELTAQTWSRNSESVVNISQEMEFTIPNNTTRTSPTSKFLQIGWAEQQTNLPWCMAYVTASIVRYKTGTDVSTVNARTVMEWAYPNLSTSDLEATALSTTKADAYANTHGLNPTYTASTRTYAQVTSEIIAGNPLAFICDNVNTGAKKAHAFVCRGYNDNGTNSFYSVWNPWYQKFERIYTSDLTYVNETGTAMYLWSATMYGWD